MKTKSVRIRVANPADAGQIAFVHTDSWRTTYRGIVTDNFLDKLNLTQQTNYWSKMLTDKSEGVFIAGDGKVIGFAAPGESNDKMVSIVYYMLFIFLSKIKKMV